MHRMARGTNHVLPFPSTFVDRMVVTSSQQWMQNMDNHGVDIFDYDVLLMPFESHGHKSIFAILGARHINDYMKYGFTEYRPCILHIVPYHAETQGLKHVYNTASAKIRTWLNVMWRMKHGRNDFETLMPFTTRSMPISRPSSKFSCTKFVEMLHAHLISSFILCYSTLSRTTI